MIAATAPAPPVTPASDFFVSRSHPRNHYGKVKELVAGRRKSYTGYMRFSLTAPVSATGRVVLRLYPLVSSATGMSVRRAAGGRWTERTAAFSSAPLTAVSGVATGPLTKGRWAEIDVTPLIGAGSTVSLGLVTTSQSPVVVAARESGPTAPQLAVASQ